MKAPITATVLTTDIEEGAINMKKLLTGMTLASALLLTGVAQANWFPKWNDNDRYGSGWGWGGGPWNDYRNGHRWGGGPSWGGNHKRWSWGDNFDMPDFNFGNRNRGRRFGWGSHSGPRFGSGGYRPYPPSYRNPGYYAPPPAGRPPMMRGPQSAPPGPGPRPGSGKRPSAPQPPYNNGG